MPPSGLAILDVMISSQMQPEKGLVLLQLLLVISFSQTQETLCRRRRDPENPLLSMDGDIILGGSLISTEGGKSNRIPIPICTNQSHCNVPGELDSKNPIYISYT